MIEAFVALGIVGWFLLLAFFMWEDVRELCGRLAADEVGAGGRSRAQASSGTDSNACADTFPAEWTVALSRPFDQEAM